MSNLLKNVAFLVVVNAAMTKIAMSAIPHPNHHSHGRRAWQGARGGGFQNIISGKNLETNSDLCFHLKIRLISQDSIDLNMNNHIEGGIIFWNHHATVEGFLSANNISSQTYEGFRVAAYF